MTVDRSDNTDDTALAALAGNGLDVTEITRRHHELTSMMLGYQYAIDQMVTRLNVLREDFNHAHGDNPIESISSRVKSPESILAKIQRKGFALNLESIQEEILEIGRAHV